MKTNNLFSIQSNVLEINYLYQEKTRKKKFLIPDTNKVDVLNKYLLLSDPERIKKNCENLVEHWVLESLDSLLEELVA